MSANQNQQAADSAQQRREQQRQRRLEQVRGLARARLARSPRDSRAMTVVQVAKDDPGSYLGGEP